MTEAGTQNLHSWDLLAGALRVVDDWAQDIPDDHRHHAKALRLLDVLGTAKFELFDVSTSPPTPFVMPPSVESACHSGSGLFSPDVAWRWGKWTFGVWTDSHNHTRFGIDIGPLEIVWRSPGYRA